MSDCKRNYQKELDKIIDILEREGRRPSLLLHACCAPCSSYTLEYLTKYFDITVFYYNPNISPKEEFDYRVKELERLLLEMPLSSPVKIVVPEYNVLEFEEKIKGLENEPERGKRCTVCYHLRLEKSAKYAKEHDYDYFTTTLSISPYKDADRLVSLGEALAEKYEIPYLVSDFKKKNGYKRSIELSQEYGLYRQNYCGCVYSARNKEEQ